MDTKTKVSSLFEIKRPSKSNTKTVINQSQCLTPSDDKELLEQPTFDVNWQLYKTKKKYLKQKHPERTNVKKIAEEFEKKYEKTNQRITLTRNNHSLKKKLKNESNKHSNFEKEIYQNTSKQLALKKETKKSTPQSEILSFTEAETEDEQENYRKKLVEQMDQEFINMKLDGFLDDEENVMSNLVLEDLNTESEKDLMFDSDMSNLPSSCSSDPSINIRMHFDDEFSESLGDDLESGSTVVEAYNDDNRELIIVQIIVDKKVIDLDSVQSIKTAIENSELVFYENEENNLYTTTTMTNTNASTTTAALGFYDNYEIKSEPTQDAEKAHQWEGFYKTLDFKKGDVPSHCGSVSEVSDAYDEVSDVCNYENINYNNVRRETFCDYNGIIRIERVGNLNKLNDSQTEYLASNATLKRNNFVPPLKKVHYILEEIKMTEKKYVADLEKVVNIFRPYIKRHCPLNLKDNLGRIFGNISKIYRKQKNFLGEIEKCEDVTTIANIFLDFEDLFDLYPVYFKNKPKADILLKVFTPIIKQMQEHFGEKLDFSAYLLTPLQRLGKYILFLENIEKELVKLELKPTTTQMALNNIKQVMSQGNDYVAIESITNNPISKLDHGSFMLRDEFTILKPRKFESFVFLFTHVIIFTINDLRSLETFNYCESIKMTDLRIASFEDGTIHLTDYVKGKRKHNTNKYTYILVAKTEKTRETWKEAIEDILWQQLLKAKEDSLRLGYTTNARQQEN